MRIRFNGGPWDGVEFEAPFRPDVIGFRHNDLRIDQDPVEPLTMTFHTAARNHHRYVFDQPKLQDGLVPRVGVELEREPEEGESLLDMVDESLLVMHYRYEPTDGPWWEHREEI